MKKTDFILIGAVLLIVVLAMFSSKGTKAMEEVNYPLALYGEKGLNQISYSDYKKLVADKEAFILIIERAGCGYCQMYMPLVEEVTKEKKISVVYIDTDTLTQDEYTELNNTNSYLKRHEWGTPTTLFMLGDRVLDSIGGYVEKEKFESFIDGKVVLG